MEHRPTHCKTCCAEFAALETESNFGLGECGACEYQQNRTRTDLLAICEAICGVYKKATNRDKVFRLSPKLADQLWLAIAHAYER